MVVRVKQMNSLSFEMRGKGRVNFHVEVQHTNNVARKPSARSRKSLYLFLPQPSKSEKGYVFNTSLEVHQLSASSLLLREMCFSKQKYKIILQIKHF